MIEYKFETKFKVGDKILAFFDGNLSYGIVDRIESNTMMYSDVKTTNNRYFCSPLPDRTKPGQRIFKENEVFKDKEELINSINKL